MAHSEAFEVITTPEGDSTLLFQLACATAKDHYTRTTTNHESEVCSTGLRVYEGAQVLASFLAQHGSSLCPTSSAADNNADGSAACSHAKHCVVELGCGCGLVGFTASHIWPEKHVIFTDASTDCLQLVGKSGTASGMPVVHMHSNTADNCIHNDNNNNTDSIDSLPSRITYPLAWSKAGVDSLKKNVLPGGDCVVDLVVGSDILYYRVDIEALLTTATDLIRITDGHSRKPLIVLAHYMRMVDGHRRLASAARSMGLCIARVPLSAILTAETVQYRGWGGMEIVILTEKDDDTHSDADALGRDAWDAACISQLLEERSSAQAPHDSGSSPLFESIQPYLGSLLGDGSAEDDMLGMLV